MYELAPIGIMSERIWKEKRLQELGEAIERYIEAAQHIPDKWIGEYNKLQEELKSR